jgi:uncharacterized protein
MNMWTVDHVVDIRFGSAVQRSPRVLDVSQAFGLELADHEFVIYDNLQFSTREGERVYITGQSGSGKSLILRAMQKHYEDAGLQVANLNDVVLDDTPIIEQLGEDTHEATRLLQIAGIGDAYLLIRRPAELSDGQRYRLRIAKLLESSAQVWLCDEFGAVLDRITAKFLAHSVAKMAKSKGITVAIATTHKDLLKDFAPHLLINKQYAHEIDMREFGSEWYEEY